MRELTTGISKVKLRTGIASAVCVLVSACCAWGQNPGEPNSATSDSIATGVELARYENEFSSVHLEPARMGTLFGVAVIFEGTGDLHYYAKAETATAPGYELKVQAKSDGFEFNQAIFPNWSTITDPLGKKVEVYVGKFIVFIPIQTNKDPTKTTDDVDVTISGQACTSTICLLPFEQTLRRSLDWSRRDSWKQISLQAPGDTAVPVQVAQGPDYSAWFALALAFIAGLGLNIMPCVWPILPLIIMRIVDQAKSGRRQSVTMGLAFCVGILLFFACLAGANIILQSFYERSLNWGDHLRNPAIVTVLSLLMIVMALFMFGIFTITVPSSIASKSGSGKGYAGSIGMGFLAAILSTPCSFGILTVAFVWAQGQPLLLGTLAIMVIGLGMAAPYAILTSMPGWLKRLPRGGRWMELFKQTLGFVLLIIAVKLIKASPAENRINLLYFAVVLSFSVWIWGTWVTYGSKISRKLLVRGIAVFLVVLAFWFFFRPELVDWQDYDPASIESAKSEQTPVLVKFTADWCTNCEIVDKFVFMRKDIAKLIDKKGVLAIKGDTTKASQPATLDLSNVYKEPGVPVTMLFLPGETEPIRLRELFFADELRTLLEALPDKN
ncbi:MAG TPA: cytochrome c biogenesis protein CcdA [Sedimentisphaerales bacterium]|nr:cytochrome c biogenesis protein CcdA [Sedimentisphaerales bacterium]